MVQHEGEDVAMEERGQEIARLQVLSTVWSVRDHGSGLAEEVVEKWSRCRSEAEATREMHLWPEGASAGRATPGTSEAAPDGLPQEHLVATGDQGGYRLASRLVTSAISRHIGTELMLHAAALTLPDSADALGFVAASGTGKTTASRVLGQAGWGYLTDECVAISPDLVVRPLAKPLSIVTDPAANATVKHQMGPDELRMARPPQTARLSGLILLRRLRTAEEVAADPGPLPRIEPVALTDALGRISVQTSALARTEGGLGRLAEVAVEVGVQEAVYEQIEDLEPLLREYGARPKEAANPACFVDLRGEAAHDTVVPHPGEDQPLPAAERWRRAGFTRAVLAENGEAVVMVGCEVTTLGPLGAAIWEQLDTLRDLPALVELLESQFGEHPQAEELVRGALEELWRRSLVEPAESDPVGTEPV